jgi:hypothetical protein
MKANESKSRLSEEEYFQVSRATPREETSLAQTYFRKTETRASSATYIGYLDANQNSPQAQTSDK